MVLTIGHVVAFAAPCVEQPDALAGYAVKQAAGKTEGFGPTGNAFLSKFDKRRSVQISHGNTLLRSGLRGNDMIEADVAVCQRSSAFIWKIVLCGT